MGAVIFILFLVAIVFISIKVSDLKHRATQHLLKNTGISSSDIEAGINSGFEKKHLERFLTENKSYTEDSIKDLLKEYAIKIFNRDEIEEFSQQLCEKIKTDSKLDKMQSMEHRRTTIVQYGNSKLTGIVTFTDNKDEYNVYLFCSIKEEKITIEKYRIDKGSVVGF